MLKCYNVNMGRLWSFVFGLLPSLHAVDPHMNLLYQEEPMDETAFMVRERFS